MQKSKPVKLENLLEFTAALACIVITVFLIKPLMQTNEGEHLSHVSSPGVDQHWVQQGSDFRKMDGVYQQIRKPDENLEKSI